MEKIWQPLLGFVILLVAGFTVYWIFREVDHNLLLGLIIGLVPSIITWILQKQRIAHEHQRWLLSDKKAYFVEIVHILSSMLAAGRKKKSMSTEDLVEKFESLRPGLITWGSPSIIRSWRELQKPSDDLSEMYRKMERFLRVIRKEAGCDDSELKPGEVTSIFLKERDKQTVLDACKKEIYP